MSQEPKKLVAVLNKDLPTGVVLNALGHMALGLGASEGIASLRLDDYRDKDGNIYPHISQIPFIVLRAKAGEIRKAVHTAKEKNIKHAIFINSMTGGGYQEQIDSTAQLPEESLIYYGCVFFGNPEDINPITKKFSLWIDKTVL